MTFHVVLIVHACIPINHVKRVAIGEGTMACKMSWDWITYKGEMIKPLVVFTTYVSNGVYRIAYALTKETDPISAYASDNVGMVYNCKSHKEAQSRVFNKVSKHVIAQHLDALPFTVKDSIIHFDRRKLENYPT